MVIFLDKGFSVGSGDTDIKEGSGDGCPMCQDLAVMTSGLQSLKNIFSFFQQMSLYFGCNTTNLYLIKRRDRKKETVRERK